MTKNTALVLQVSFSLVFLNVLSIRPSICCRKIQDIHELSSLDCANFSKVHLFQTNAARIVIRLLPKHQELCRAVGAMM